MQVFHVTLSHGVVWWLPSSTAGTRHTRVVEDVPCITLVHPALPLYLGLKHTQR